MYGSFAYMYVCSSHRSQKKSLGKWSNSRLWASTDAGNQTQVLYSSSTMLLTAELSPEHPVLYFNVENYPVFFWKSWQRQWFSSRVSYFSRKDSFCFPLSNCYLSTDDTSAQITEVENVTRIKPWQFPSEKSHHQARNDANVNCQELSL